jgi:hypothetical protein
LATRRADTSEGLVIVDVPERGNPQNNSAPRARSLVRAAPAAGALRVADRACSREVCARQRIGLYRTGDGLTEASLCRGDWSPLADHQRAAWCDCRGAVIEATMCYLPAPEQAAVAERIATRSRLA